MIFSDAFIRPSIAPGQLACAFATAIGRSPQDIIVVDNERRLPDPGHSYVLAIVYEVDGGEYPLSTSIYIFDKALLGSWTPSRLFSKVASIANVEILVPSEEPNPYVFDFFSAEGHKTVLVDQVALDDDGIIKELHIYDRPKG